MLDQFLVRHRPDDHLFTRILADEARAQAVRSDERRRAGRSFGSLDGVPVAVKDCIAIAGAPTTNGSVVDASPVAPRDAGIVRALRGRGLVIVGKTNQSELAFSGLGTNPHFGSPVNPLSIDEPLVPGGSSSGSAAAVASGLVPLALGTDTSGSVRIPAAFCGIVGYKSTEARFPLDGVRRLSPTLDSIGFLARSLADLHQALAGLGMVGAVTAEQPVGVTRFVVPDGELVEDCDHDVRVWFEQQVERLSDHGDLVVERRTLPVLREAQALIDARGTLVAAEAHGLYGHYLDGPSARRLDPAVARRLRDAASAAGSADLLRARMPGLRARIAQELGGALLLCPTVRHRPPRMSEVMASGTAFDRVNARTLRTTLLLSYLGMPGVSLPLGVGRVQGLGMLVSSAWAGDDRVLRAATLVDRLAP
jgi:aspartyl-tRNA(Asn)/glutamyl-tRNA(Gln) amidotransferase subunit A